MRSALDRLKGLLDNVLPRLREHLYCHVVRYHISFYQSTHKLILGLRCRRKTDLDLLKADLDKHLKKLQFLVQTHRLDQRLITVP